MKTTTIIARVQSDTKEQVQQLIAFVNSDKGMLQLKQSIYLRTTQPGDILNCYAKLSFYKKPNAMIGGLKHAFSRLYYAALASYKKKIKQQEFEIDFVGKEEFKEHFANFYPHWVQSHIK